MSKLINRWFHNLIYRLIGLDCGPVMIKIRGHYLYLDPYGQIWLVKPTGQHDIPLTISLLER